MAVALATPQSPKPTIQYNKRKRTDLNADLQDAVGRLQRLISRVNEAMTELPLNMQPLVDLLQTQTQMIEVLASYRGARLTRHRSSDPRALMDTAKIVTTPLEPVCVEAVKNCTNQPTGSSKPQAVHRASKGQTPQLRMPRRRQSHIAEIAHVPTPQIFDFKSGIVRAGSPSKSTHSASTTTSCSTCSTQPWYPLSSDFDHEALIQEASTRIIAAMKCKTRVPVGPVDNATFNLYSADYRQNHYCVHDRTDRQQLVAYSHSKTWEADFPGITPPRPGEVAMELLVYPDCLLIIKPFKVPKNAGWKWHTLDAIGDDARPTTVEIMFLGNGYLKLKVRLSELLGEDRMAELETDRWIEFAGVWAGQFNTTDEVCQKPEGSSPVEPIMDGHGYPLAAAQLYQPPKSTRYVLPPLPALPPLDEDMS